MTTYEIPTRQGKSSALLIGINYTGTPNELNGCINDVETMEEMITKGGYEICKMTDYFYGTKFYPTEENIIKELELLAKKSWGEYTRFVIQFSGHGTFTIDTSSDEDDSKDEGLVSIDLKVITDDRLNKIIQKFSPWSTVFIFTDACHSGTVFDLPIHYIDPSHIQIENTQMPHAQVIKISGCRDDQTSADAYNVPKKEYAGAMTSAFMKCKTEDKPFLNLIEDMKRQLKIEAHLQRPQLTSSRIIPKDLCIKHVLF